MAGARLQSVIAPFGVRNYRVQWMADLLASLAFEMELLLLGWYVLTETGSVMWLTAFGAMYFYGTIFSPLFGVAGDRVGHRNLLCVMRGWYLAIALTLMTLAFLGKLGPWMVLALSALMGFARPSDLSVRAATVVSIVPQDMLVGALGNSRATSDIARIAGALTGAGVLAGMGMGSAYVVVSACYASSLLLVLLVRPPVRDGASDASLLAASGRASVGPSSQPYASGRPSLSSASLPSEGGRPSPQPSPDARTGHGERGKQARASPWRDLVEGLAYVWNTPRLRAAMWLAFLMNATTLPLSGGLLAYVAKGVYHTDQSGLGLLSASFAAGAFIGSMVLSASGQRLPFARVMMSATLAWCALLVVFAQVTTASTGMVLLAIAGFLQSLSMVTMAMMLLATSVDQMRGRVMGVRMLAIISQVPGLPLAGWMIERWGFATMATIYAGGALVVTLFILVWWWSELWPIGARGNGGDAQRETEPAPAGG